MQMFETCIWGQTVRITNIELCSLQTTELKSPKKILGIWKTYIEILP